METEGSGASRAGGGDLTGEEAYLIEEGLGLYVVCDGGADGGLGRAAAGVAVHALEEHVTRAEEKLGRDLLLGLGSKSVVEKGLKRALRAVVKASSEETDLGPITAVTMLLTHRSRGVIGHVGDSRAYLIRGGRAHQLTHDHELTSAVPDEGGQPIEVFAIALEARDTLVLCTDGAEEVVEDPGLARVAADLSPALLASRIVSLAQLRNAEVDATAVVVRLRGEREPGWLALSNAPRLARFGHTLSYA